MTSEQLDLAEKLPRDRLDNSGPNGIGPGGEPNIVSADDPPFEPIVMDSETGARRRAEAAAPCGVIPSKGDGLQRASA